VPNPENKATFADAEALFAAGQLALAEAGYRPLTQEGLHAAEACFRLGQITRRLGRASEASVWLNQALVHRAQWPEAHYEMALTCLALQKAQEAVFNLHKALELQPAHAGALRTLADLYRAAGRWREAVQNYAALLPLQPDDPTLFQYFGLCCQELDELQLAERAYLKTLRLGLDSPELQFNLGAVRLKQRRPQEAIVCFQNALQKDPRLTMANSAMANAYRLVGDLASAESCLRRELEINPNCADAAVNLGVVLQEKQRVGEAISCYRQAIHLNPHHPILRWNYAIASLLAGDYETGWQEYEWRWHVKHKPKPKFQQPEWDGRDLAGRTILLYAEQGFGDTLMFIRYAPLIAQRNGRVVLECQPPLKRLLAAMPELFRVVAEGEPLPQFDVHAPLMSLPRLFGSALDAEHRWEPYLRVPSGVGMELPVHPGRSLKVGLAWASNPRHPIFSEKSLDLKRWEPILKVPHCEFFSLQIDPSPSALAFMKEQPHLHALHDQIHDFADTAGAIRRLDLVISVDTSVAHLAGGLGHTVWVMLPFSADWRWLLKRKDSPWYPTMRLFRQPQSGDWDSVVTDVVQHLTELAARH
jgi:tetratricopeptide (TPR) repeat protein